MSDFNFDENTVNKLKDMMNKGELSDVISQIPPEMIQNFSSMLNNSNTSSNQSSSNSNSSYSSQSNTNSNISNRN
ncbi:MAG: hypothetical protein V8R81_07735 [Clostridia bacterium]